MPSTQPISTAELVLDPLGRLDQAVPVGDVGGDRHRRIPEIAGDLIQPIHTSASSATG
jgi:hypothetical protein